MKISKTNIVLYSVIALLAIIAAHSKFQQQKLHNTLDKIAAEKSIICKEFIVENGINELDSLLMLGEYESAMMAYEEKFKDLKNENSDYVKFRIEIAKQLVNFRESTNALEKQDSASKQEVSGGDFTITHTYDDRVYDSLNFALEKAKVQLSRIKKQLKKRTYGEYLTFKNRKKNQVYYVGQVRNGKAQGLGIGLFDSGSRYEGRWKDNLREGEGTFFWADGEYYKGSYKNDLRNGLGTYFWPNGEKYIGNWKDDHRDGKGIFYGKDGKVITKGTWKKDKLVSEE